MAFSSNPAVRELQNGVAFAFRPVQGALDSVARDGVVRRSTHRRDRPAAPSTTPRSAPRTSGSPPRTPGSTEIQRENELADRAPPAARRPRLPRPSAARHRPRVVRVPPRWSSSTRAPTTGSRSATSWSRPAARWPAGSPRSGRTAPRSCCSPTAARPSSASCSTNAATGEVIGQLGGVLVMQTDRRGRDRRGRRRGRHRRHRARRRRPLAVPQGPPDRPGRRRPARRERRRPDRLPAAGGAARQARVPAGHHRLPGRPAADRAAAGRLRRRAASCPRASSRASRRARRRRPGRPRLRWPRRSRDGTAARPARGRVASGLGCYPSPR